MNFSSCRMTSALFVQYMEFETGKSPVRGNILDILDKIEEGCGMDLVNNL